MRISGLFVTMTLAVIWSGCVVMARAVIEFDDAMYWTLILVGGGVIGWNGDAIRDALWKLVGRE
jgi:hypothetical protein